MLPGWLTGLLAAVPVVRKLVVPVVREIAEDVKPPPTVAESNAKGEAAEARQREAFEELRRKK